MDEQEKNKLRRTTLRNKSQASVRNAKATLQMLQLGNFFVFIAAAGIKTIETTLDRFSDQTIYSVVITVLVGALNVVYLLMYAYFSDKNISPLFDASLRKNRYQQYGVYLILVPFISATFIAIRWTLYAVTDNNSSFDNNANDAVMYTFGSLVEWFLAVFNVYLIFSAFGSFTVQQPHVYKMYAERGIRWSHDLFGFVRPEYVPDKRRTDLKPGPLTANDE